MTDKSENLWGIDFHEMHLESPRGILAEQARHLEHATDSLLQGKLQIGKYDTSNLLIDFFIVAIYLDNYQYHLFRVIQPVTMFPLVVSSDILEKELNCDNIKQFKEIIQNILSNKMTQKVVSALLTQSREEFQSIQ